jgi:menaquinone-dependent protoporphyrinogen IX oxidase
MNDFASLKGNHDYRAAHVDIARWLATICAGGSMNVCIIHDSQKGNGRKMAEALASEFESKGAQVVVGHRAELSPKQVAASPPDLLVVGAAVRAFVTSPPTKRWITRLGAELKKQNAKIPRAAVFLTHVMPDEMVEGRVGRLKKSLSRVPGIGEVYSEWLSGQVKNMPGPFIDGALEKAATFAAALSEWAQPKT